IPRAFIRIVFLVICPPIEYVFSLSLVAVVGAAVGGWGVWVLVESYQTGLTPYGCYACSQFIEEGLGKFEQLFLLRGAEGKLALQPCDDVHLDKVDLELALRFGECQDVALQLCNAHIVKLILHVVKILVALNKRCGSVISE